jgi:hypothetical protein
VALGEEGHSSRAIAGGRLACITRPSCATRSQVVQTHHLERVTGLNGVSLTVAKRSPDGNPVRLESGLRSSASPLTQAAVGGIIRTGVGPSGGPDAQLRPLADTRPSLGRVLGRPCGPRPRSWTGGGLDNTC